MKFTNICLMFLLFICLVFVGYCPNNVQAISYGSDFEFFDDSSNWDLATYSIISNNNFYYNNTGAVVSASSLGQLKNSYYEYNASFFINDISHATGDQTGYIQLGLSPSPFCIRVVMQDNYYTFDDANGNDIYAGSITTTNDFMLRISVDYLDNSTYKVIRTVYKGLTVGFQNIGSMITYYDYDLPNVYEIKVYNENISPNEYSFIIDYIVIDGSVNDVFEFTSEPITEYEIGSGNGQYVYDIELSRNGVKITGYTDCPGLTIYDDGNVGMVYGTPTIPGTYDVHINATLNGITITQNYKLTIYGWFNVHSVNVNVSVLNHWVEVQNISVNSTVNITKFTLVQISYVNGSVSDGYIPIDPSLPDYLKDIKIQEYIWFLIFFIPILIFTMFIPRVGTILGTIIMSLASLITFPNGEYIMIMGIITSTIMLFSSRGD